nr:PTS fructose transporter subunit IIB [uncultured Caproiciproducens sp.]
MKSCKILCICGSGTVSSAMVAGKIKEQLKEKGWDVHAVEASPSSAGSVIPGGNFDLMACVSPVYEDFGIPKVKAVGMLTGMSEGKVLADILAILEEKYK